jgi:hypothetical protein
MLRRYQLLEASMRIARCASGVEEGCVGEHHYWRRCICGAKPKISPTKAYGQISQIVDGNASVLVEVSEPAAVEVAPDGTLYATTDAFGNGRVVIVTP